MVLAGGVSTERDVSLSSGKMVFGALKSKGHQVILMDVYLGYGGENPETVFERCKVGADFTPGGVESFVTGGAVPDLSAVKAMREHPETGYFGPGVLAVCAQADVVFLALHGEDGENGKVQAVFALWGIPYTGSGCLGSGVAMDKGLSKELFALHGIPTPKGIVCVKGRTAEVPFDFPRVVKTLCGGSSVGVYVVRGQEAYEEALEKAFALEEEVLVEEYIPGREFSVGVVGGKALPVIEIVPESGFYDYRNKYMPGAAKEFCPADLPRGDTVRVQELSEKVFAVLRLRSYARIDFLMNGDNGIFYCLEANTLPGMTPTSLLPQEAAAMGVDFAALCEWIIETSMEKRG